MAGEAGSTHAGQENSQRVGSEVLLYTEGDTAMDFLLSFPPSDDLGCDIDAYITRTATTARFVPEPKSSILFNRSCQKWVLPVQIMEISVND